MAQEMKAIDGTVEGGKDDSNTYNDLQRMILDTICFYAENEEQRFKNTPISLPQMPLFVGNAVRSITFRAKFHNILLQSHPHQVCVCYLSC